MKQKMHIDDGKLLFIGNNKEKFNFNTIKKLLNFLVAIYNGQISLKEAEFKKKKLRSYKNNEEKKRKRRNK